MKPAARIVLSARNAYTAARADGAVRAEGNDLIHIFVYSRISLIVTVLEIPRELKVASMAV